MRRMIDLSHKLKVLDENIDLITEILQQRDARYVDNDSAIVVAYFLENSGIEIENDKISGVYSPPKNDLKNINGKQQFYKFLGKKHLEEKGYEVIGFEIPIQGGRTDILAKNSSKNETVAVECGPCRTDKAIEYLRKENTVLWVIPLSEINSLDNKTPIFIIERGPNWDRCIKLYDQLLREQLRKVRSPMDDL